jgi:predicted PurR-regulated permease PerM
MTLPAARGTEAGGAPRDAGVLPGFPRRLLAAGVAAWCAVGVAAAVLLVGWAVGRLLVVVVPTLAAVLVVALLRPFAGVLAGHGLSPGLAAAMAMLALLAAIALCVVVVVPPTLDRFGELGASVERGARQVGYSAGRELLGADHAQVDRAVDQVVRDIRGHSGRLLGRVVTGASVVATALGGAVLTLFLAFFGLKDGPRIWGWVVGLVPEARRAGVQEAAGRAWAALSTYVHGIVLVATVDAVGIGAVLLAVGVPLALPLIVLTWVSAFFPIVGALVAGAAAALVALVADGLGPALVVLGGVVLVQQFEGNVLYPVVVGPRLNLHPTAVLLAMAVGAALAGIAGAFMAMPVTTVLATLLQWSRERPQPAPLFTEVPRVETVR